MKFKRAKRAIAQTPQVTDDESAVAHFAGCFLVFHGSWGSASLHPRLYAVAALRGLENISLPWSENRFHAWASLEFAMFHFAICLSQTSKAIRFCKATLR
jgi:hypothetical protein